jgi:phospholipase C
MHHPMRLSVMAFAGLALGGCGSHGNGASGDAGKPPLPPAYCDGGTCIEHVVVIVQENHTFDTHFGGYCTAPAGSNPSCTTGPSCCEAMPATDPSGAKPVVLTDHAHAVFDPNHDEACEITEVNGGKMDGFVVGDGGGGCPSPQNLAIADPTIIKPYWDLAGENALADRYFQPMIGASWGNDMFLAGAGYQFTDNQYGPQGAVGLTCNDDGTPKQLTGKTIGDLLTAASVTWAWFNEGYAAMQAAAPGCANSPPDCPFPLPTDPCVFDPGDVPFEFFASTVDNAATMKDAASFESALTSGALPQVSFVKAVGYHQEHPGHDITLSAGVKWATGIIQSVESSPYAASTLVLLTYDEGGGFYDHVAPPPANTADGQPYGTRVPLLAVGPFVKTNYVSHVVLEHSSIVKFLEWNFLGQKTGQLGGRDANVNNLGSLLDPNRTGIAVPE